MLRVRGWGVGLLGKRFSLACPKTSAVVLAEVYMC